MFHPPATETKQKSDSNRTELQPAYAPMRAQQRLAQLHGTYGNQAVLRMLSHASPAIQRSLTPRQQGLEGLGISVDEKRELEISNLPVEPRVQRSTSWEAETLHESINLAKMVLGGAEPTTVPKLNDTLLDDDAKVDPSINVPGVSVTGAGKNFRAKVDSVPGQKGSADETVLAPGPWSVVATKVEVGNTLGLAACTGAGNSTFSAYGKRTDNVVYNANRRHEDHHVTDDKAAFATTVVEWDKKVEKAKKDGTEFRGDTADAAKAALWTAMGGTPQEIAEKYAGLTSEKGRQFHATAAGRKMSGSNFQANADCSTSSVDVRNPS